ncbi:MAG: class I SAM-dependent methyltransferase, partial [Elusimicrobiota bacterium]
MNRRQFFNQCAVHGDSRPDLQHSALIKNFLLPLFKLKKNQSVLDVGTGTGTLLPYLRAMTGKRASIVGLDFSPGMLERAREQYARPFTFVCAPAHDMPFSTASFDAVVSLDVFPHFQDKLAALNECRRVLKDGGKLIIAHTGSRGRINARLQKIGGPLASDTIPSDDVMMNLLLKAGFSKVKIRAKKNIHYSEAFK